MDDQQWHAILNGILYHPNSLIMIQRLQRALKSVVEYGGDPAESALQRFCNQTVIMDRAAIAAINGSHNDVM
jgi:hypothetical protein